ncbi:MAG: OmpP1/FadL family transporter [Bacteroidota bacterium]|jgi:long-subunit fatty acid transport protein
MKKYILLLYSLMCVWNVYAQNEDEILRYSQQFQFGTARSQAVGGAFGAVGADFSATSINPAGIGLYRRNEIHLSTAINYNNNRSSYLNTTTNEGRTNLTLPSMGVVITKVFNEMGKDVQQGLASLSVAAGYNRINNFQSTQSYSGNNTSSSIVNSFVEQANGTPYQNFDKNFPVNDPANMAWRLYIIDTLPGSSATYINRYARDTSSQFNHFAQSGLITNRGAMNEYNVTAGVNISNLIYMGASLVLTHAYRESELVFNERIVDPLMPGQHSLSYRQLINASGTGVGGRFGIIVRPVDLLRIGFSAQTRTRINMREDYNFEMREMNIADVYRGPNDFIEYQIVTPFRFTGSVMLMAGKKGFITADVEMIDYSTGYISSSFDFSRANTNAANLYRQVYNIRAGAEWRLSDMFMLRGGYAVIQSPYKKELLGNITSDLNMYQISGGAGVLIDRFFYDFTVSHLFGQSLFTPYTVSNGKYSSVLNNFSFTNFALTAGYRF